MEGDGSITLYLVRHGKTFLNTTDQVQGWIDSPLTEKGRARRTPWAWDEGYQVRFRLQQRLGTPAGDRPVSWPRMGPAPELREVIGLREWFYGGYEGK